MFTTAHAEAHQTSSAAVKHDQLCFPEQSRAPPRFTQGTDALAQADLAAWFVYTIAMNTLFSALPSWPYILIIRF